MSEAIATDSKAVDEEQPANSEEAADQPDLGQPEVTEGQDAEATEDTPDAEDKTSVDSTVAA